MSFRARSTDDLVRIVMAGGGITLAAAGRSTDDLVRIAAAAARNNVQVIFRDLDGRTTDDIVRIVSVGGGHVHVEGAINVRTD